MTQLSFLRFINKAVQQLTHKNHLLPHQKIRFCSSQPHVLHSQSFNVPSFGGSLWIKSHYNVHVQPTNTMDYPNLDQAFVKVLTKDQSLAENVSVDVSQDGAKLRVIGSVKDQASVQYDDVTLHVEVPIVYDVNVDVEGGGKIHCRDMIESQYCHLSTHHGDIRAAGVKTSQLRLQSQTGEIRCSGAIQGSVNIVSGSGDVVSEKRFLGPSLDITTDSGDILISSCYSDQSRFTTNTGSMRLRNIHHDSSVTVLSEAEVSMTGVDGSTRVNMKKGRLEVQVSRVRSECRIHVEDGDVELKMSDSHPVQLRVTGNTVDTDQTFAQHGAVETRDGLHHYTGALQPHQSSPLCLVVSELGRVSVRAEGWAQSIGFKNPSQVD